MKRYSVDKTKIENPATGRMVLVSGKIGKKVEKMSDDEYNDLVSSYALSKKDKKPSRKLKEVILKEQQKI